MKFTIFISALLAALLAVFVAGAAAHDEGNHITHTVDVKRPATTYLVAVKSPKTPQLWKGYYPSSKTITVRAAPSPLPAPASPSHQDKTVTVTAPGPTVTVSAGRGDDASPPPATPSRADSKVPLSPSLAEGSIAADAATSSGGYLVPGTATFGDPPAFTGLMVPAIASHNVSQAQSATVGYFVPGSQRPDINSVLPSTRRSDMVPAEAAFHHTASVSGTQYGVLVAATVVPHGLADDGKDDKGGPLTLSSTSSISRRYLLVPATQEDPSAKPTDNPKTRGLVPAHKKPAKATGKVSKRDEPAETAGPEGEARWFRLRR